MDIKCHKCGEPWEIDSLHDAVAEGHAVDFEDARKAFYRDGCAAIGASHSRARAENVRGARRREALDMLQDLLGDDIDGLAAMTEDFGL